VTSRGIFNPLTWFKENLAILYPKSSERVLETTDIIDNKTGKLSKIIKGSDHKIQCLQKSMRLKAAAIQV
jgi:hypothetical protein